MSEVCAHSGAGSCLAPFNETFCHQTFYHGTARPVTACAAAGMLKRASTDVRGQHGLRETREAQFAGAFTACRNLRSDP
jgi:hypothetical protein